MSGLRPTSLANLSANVLSRVSRRLSVTDFIPSDCEIRRLFQKLDPPEDTRAIKRGKRMHELREYEIMKNVEGWKPLEVLSTTSEGEVYESKLDQMSVGFKLLAKKQDVAELRIAGSIDGITLTGVVDHMVYDSARAAYTIVDLKTTKSKDPPPTWKIRPAYFQLLMYHWMLGELLHTQRDVFPLIYRPEHDEEFDRFNREAGLSSSLETPREFPQYRKVIDAVDLARRSSPRIEFNPVVRVEYRNGTQSGFDVDIKVNDATIKDLHSFMLTLWTGERAPLPVSPDNHTHCDYCTYKAECPAINELPDAPLNF